MTRTGRCLCGACAYTIEGDPIVAAHCCCLDCQRASGAGHATGAMFSDENFLLTGTPSEFGLRSAAGDDVVRVFCGDCGSPLYTRHSGMEGFVIIAAGSLDDPDSLTPEMILFAGSRRGWDAFDATLPSHAAYPPEEPA